MTIQLKTNPTDKVIELGGGSHPLVRPNVDVRVCHDEKGQRTVDFTADFHQPLPIQSNEWDGVFSQFAIEHIAYPKVPQFIAEVFRILKPGGKAVVVTANTEAQLRWALDHPEGWDGKDMFESASCKLFGDQRHGEREGDPNPGHDSHKAFFSPAILKKLFEDAGFEHVHTTPYGARDTDIVVEAVKPREVMVKYRVPNTLNFLAGSSEEMWKEEERLVMEGNPEVPKPQGVIYAGEEIGGPVVEGFQHLAQKEKERLEEKALQEIHSDLPLFEPIDLEAKKIPFLARVHPDSPWGSPTVTPSPEEIERLRKAQTEAHVQAMERSLLHRSYQPERMFNREYWNGGAYKPFYWDFPAHELTARHVLSRKPESVLEIGCARGYVLKRIQDAGVVAAGMDVSKHCYMTRVADAINLVDICKTPWVVPDHHTQVRRDVEYDLCFSIAVLDHIPEEYLPDVFAEMERTCKRGLHGVNFGPQGDDKTRVTIHPKEWWQLRLPRGHEVVDKNELEGGQFPEDVYRGDGKIKLNIGCAQTMFHHGWTNIDIHNLQQWAQGHGYQYQPIDVRNGIPWGTGDVSLIYCGHMLEHLSYKEGLTFLRECRRVIKPDGAMRIIVPNAELLLRSYGHGCCWDTQTNDNDFVPPPSLSDFDEVNEGCALAPTAAGKLWSLLLEGHQAVYDAETLVGMLEQAGFDAKQVSFRIAGYTAAGCSQILRETLDTHPALSLFVDAVPRLG